MTTLTSPKDIFEVVGSKVDLNSKTQDMQKPINFNKRIQKMDRKKSEKEKRKETTVTNQHQRKAVMRRFQRWLQNDFGLFTRELSIHDKASLNE